MNKRIEELEKQCYYYSTWHDDTIEFDREKFAELIIHECEKSIKSVPTHFEAQDKIIVECLKSIRETFWS